MKRTFNYTDRRRIDRKHVQIRLVDSTPEGTTIDVSAELSEYNFPITAKVFIEARDESVFARRELENPFDPFWRDQLRLDEIVVTDTTKFLFRVVEDETTGRMLGLAENIPLVNPADLITERDALLPVEWGDTGQEVWRLKCDPALGPKLYISKGLQDNFALFSNDPMFVACVVPQAFRRILEFALLGDDMEDAHEPESWFHEWYRWMMSLSDLRPLALQLEERSDEDDLESWINEAVDSFSKMRPNRFVNKVSAVLKERN